MVFEGKKKEVGKRNLKKSVPGTLACWTRGWGGGGLWNTEPHSEYSGGLGRDLGDQSLPNDNAISSTASGKVMEIIFHLLHHTKY